MRFGNALISGAARLAAVLLLSVASQGAPHVVQGVLRSHLEDGRLLIEHEEIPGFMAAMTMAFTPVDPAAAGRLAVGDRLRFLLHTEAGEFRVDGFTILGTVHAPQPARAAPASGQRRLQPGDQVPEFSLLDESGRTFTAARWPGALTVVTFIFTRCPVPEYCPTQARKFAALQDALSRESGHTIRGRLLSITLDPEFDRPEILAAYGQAVGARPDIWNFATGETAQIQVLTRAFAVYAERQEGVLEHTLCTALIGPEGRIREIWRGSAWTPGEVLQTLHQARAELP